MHDDAAALARAHQFGIRVASLGSPECWSVESSEPTLRGAYLVIVLDDEARCECAAGLYRETTCHHREAVRAALTGAYPVSSLAEIRSPGAIEAATNGHVWTPPAAVVRQAKARDTATAARRARQTTPEPLVSARDYETLFPE